MTIEQNLARYRKMPMELPAPSILRDLETAVEVIKVLRGAATQQKQLCDLNYRHDKLRGDEMHEEADVLLGKMQRIEDLVYDSLALAAEKIGV